VSDLDLEPLVRAGSDPLERAVLESARRDVPTSPAKAQLLAALEPAPVPSAASAPAPSWLGKLGGRYALGVALVVGVGAAVVLSEGSHAPVASNERPVAPVAPVASVASSAKAMPPAEPVEPPTSDTGVANSEPLPPPLGAKPLAAGGEAAPTPPLRRVPVARVAPTMNVAPSSEPPAESTLARELARVGAARSALAAGDAPRTLQLLDAYNAEFPTGAFLVEVAVLRIEALARSGRGDEARRLGDSFLAEHPKGAFARRVAITLRSVAPASQDSTLAPPRD
jgi:hypothetical protein